MASLRPTNPSTGELLPEVPCASPEQVAQVVAEAHTAQQGWAQRPFDERAAAVRDFADRLSQQDTAERLAQTLCTEMGKPIRQARAEVRTVAGRTSALIEAARAACRDEVATEGAIQVVTAWRPLGVVAVIAPWNFPIATPHNLVASALLTGNGCVLKPSEYCPRTGALYHELLSADLSSGLFGLVQGDGSVGRELVLADVNMVGFTGSIATGQAIMRDAAAGLKRLVLEMGGKDPMIVLEGADLEAAARYAVRAALSNSGQVCISVERVLVERSIHDAFTEQVLERVRKMRVGDPRDEATDIGPMANAHQREQVLEQVAEAKARGATVLIEGEARSPGFFLSPTVLDDVKADMDIARDETFGPVIAIETVGDADEAVELANATRYGLGASVWGAPGQQLDRIADRIEAGMVGVNRGLSAAAGAPWVGWKMSGFGYSRGVAGMRQFMQPRTRSTDVF